jgi:hypothetical protein
MRLFEIILLIAVVSINCFNIAYAVTCSCPCKFGAANGLSGTLEYRQQCFSNGIFSGDNFFSCNLDMGKCR